MGNHYPSGYEDEVIWVLGTKSSNFQAEMTKHAERNGFQEKKNKEIGKYL
jgi:hypothetical protein